jgi:hypothetical protein
MVKAIARNGRWLWIILAYGFAAIAVHMNYNSAYHDEALNVLMGRQLLSGEFCPGCAQNTGSVLIQPIFAALGDSVGGLYGARAVGVPFGLGLTAVVCFTARLLFSGTHGIVSAVLFVFTGTVLYLSKLATYDIISAFFLGLSFLLILLSEKERNGRLSSAYLFGGASALFLSAMTKYVAAVFIPPFIVYTLWRHGLLKTSVFFLMPLLLFVGAYFPLAIWPAKDSLFGSSSSVLSETQVPFRTLSSWTLRWVGMPALLSAFGMFHEEKGKIVFLLVLLSSPIILLHLITGAEQSVNKNVIYSIIFLTPAAALGVDHMGSIFSSKSPGTWVKPFFVASVLVVVWAFGIHELGWLERQYPNMKPVISFFKDKGFNGMTVTIDSDYGDAVYSYALEKRLPGALFYPISGMQKKTSGGRIPDKPDFVILDGYYGKKSLKEAAVALMGNDYTLVGDFKIPLSWGVSDVKIFQRR